MSRYENDEDDPFGDVIQSKPAQSRPVDPFSEPRNPFADFAEPSPSGLERRQLDPFFDDEDDDFRAPSPISLAPSGYLAPQPSVSNRYGVSSSSKTIDSDLPLAQFAAPPAGHFSSAAPSGSGGDYQQNYEFDAQPPRAPPRRWWKEIDWDVRGIWRSRGKVEEGVTRRIVLNDPVGNEQTGFERNSVSTGKYNVVTFLPIFFFEQFSKAANVFFLFTALIQQVPGVSPTGRYTTILPLGLVLIASAFKEAEEDIKRHNQDRSLNNSLAKVLFGSQFFDKAWKHLRVGDVVRLEKDEFIPADLVLISSSEPEGLCYVETSNLDGETNLKIKQAIPQTANLTSPTSVSSLKGHILSESPNASVHTYTGSLNFSSASDFNAASSAPLPLGPDQMLLRGAQIRNTGWVYGIVVVGGKETKLMRNATAAPVKRTSVERRVNRQIFFMFIALIVLSLVSTVGSSIRSWVFSSKQWYLAGDISSNKAKQFIEDILTFIILYNNLIPISLIVTMEVVKYQQAQFINSDLDMYHAKTDTPALCRTSSLVEELGQIEYIFSDKTGTLTCNEMEFRQCTIAGIEYADVVEDAKRGERGPDGSYINGQRTFEELRSKLDETDREAEVRREFLTLLAVCHTVIPEVKDDGKMVYQASSPDEAALVAGAELLGFRFHTRKPRSIFVDVQGETLEYEILNVCEFNSTRKRMSTIVRGPDGKIKLYCKGADTVIFERLAPNNPYVESTMAHLEDYATEGLRTLCLAVREIPLEEYREWLELYNRAAAQITGRGDALDNVAELIEKDLNLLGATAIEDKLQDGVPDTIHTLQQAGIKVWVLTGDRQETAINIGLSCRLITESMNLVIVNETTAHDTEQFLSKRLQAIKNQRSSGDNEDLALVIDGKSLTFALEKDLSKIFLELALMCKAVVCCRVSPLQKALVVKLVKDNTSSILLAIGDGANDVPMIQAAHVGVGISGVEGLQAARSSDVAISQFRFLKKLLLVHGAWSYQRLSKLILYSFYKNIVLYMTQFYYSFFNNFSGQIAMEGWTLSFYNVTFTLLPPLVIGIFDQFVSARMLDRYPQLYRLGQQNYFFSAKAFWSSVVNALYHSALLFTLSVIVFWGGLLADDGRDGGHWVWGTTLYLTVLLTVLGKAALLSDIWTKYTLAAIPGSFLFTMAFLPLYALIAPLCGWSKEYRGIVPRLWGDSVFYFCLILFPIVCLVRDYVWKYYTRTTNPQSYHIVQEIQKFNLSDYRPREEQFQKAIKKVRATQRLRRSRGFAFSQTEGSAQEQTRIIRAYDTTQAAPSGL